MSSVNDAVRILHAYVRKTGNPHMSLENFIGFAVKFVERFKEEQPDLVDLAAGDGAQRILEYVKKLEEQNWLTTERGPGDEITSIYYRSFFAAEIKAWYTKIGEDRELPFPNDEQFKLPVPSGLVKTVQVDQSIMEWLSNENADPQQILHLRFPDNVRDMYITIDILQNQLPTLALGRIREYLRSEKNASYMESKLRAVFRTRDVLVHELIQTALTKPEEVIQTVVKPNEFQFHFWTQLSSIIVKDFSKKNDKLDSEHGYCQAAYMLGYLSVYHKGVHQKVQERESTIKLITDKLVQPPFLFTIPQVYEFSDDKGVPITKKLPREQINDLIEEMMTPQEDEAVSKLVSINTDNNRAMIIHRSQYIPVLLKRLSKLSRTIQQLTIGRMTDLLYDNISKPWMKDDEEFDTYLRDLVFEHDSVVFAMLEFRVLFLVVDGQELPAVQREAVYRFFDRQRSTMMPWRVILSLDRERLLKDAKLRLPLWMLIPIIRGIVRLFMKKRPKRSEASASDAAAMAPSAATSVQSRAEQLKEYKEKITQLTNRYLTSSGQSPQARLEELHKQWNPLIEKQARTNLVEDVQSLCRDTLRKMRLTARKIPPTPERIRELSTRIAGNSAFDRIRDRQAFQSYLELYMLQILSK